MSAEQIFKRLSDAVVEMEEEFAVETAHEALAQGVDAYDAIEKGLSDGMARAGQLFKEEEYFIPELLTWEGTCRRAVSWRRHGMRRPRSSPFPPS